MYNVLFAKVPYSICFLTMVDMIFPIKVFIKMNTYKFSSFDPFQLLPSM